MTAIVVPDATRKLDYRTALTDLCTPLSTPLTTLGATVIVGLGLHRPMTDDEIAPLRAVCDDLGHTLVQHDPNDTVDDFAPQIVDADEIVCVGVVEPHQYAGFSGGVKGVVIGCGSADRIAEMHSLPMLRACRARVGWLEGNPFQERLREFARDLPPMRARFFVPGHATPFDGDVDDAFERAVARSRELHFRDVEPVDSMLLRVPPAKAVNFYQASRAATYVALADRPAIREGGTLYIEAACPEGIGRGPGELACAEAMRRGPDRLLDELARDHPPRTRGGEQRAYVLAMALERANIVLVGPALDELGPMGIETTGAAPAVDLVIDDPFHSVPISTP